MWKKKIFIFLLIVIAAIVGYFAFASTFRFSEGTRTGYLSKFTKRGFVFKTYEGEMFMGGATADNSTVINTTWQFSVKPGDQAAIESLHQYEGNVVKVYYYQILKNMPWQGDTEYYVYKVDFVREK